MEAPVIFFATYASLLLFPKFRAYSALGAGALFVLLGILPLGKLFSSVDWNVIMMIAVTMGIVQLFIESGMPSKMADRIIRRPADAVDEGGDREVPDLDAAVFCHRGEQIRVPGTKGGVPDSVLIFEQQLIFLAGEVVKDERLLVIKQE